MGDKNKGLYRKFVVNRTDGKDKPGEKHYGCQYFVLDITHDPFALRALAEYGRACRKEYPQLFDDILNIVGDDLMFPYQCDYSNSDGIL